MRLVDILHFLKEEYSAIRAELPTIAPGDLSKTPSELYLKGFMTRLELVVRVGADLILPEVMDSSLSAASVAMLAEDQLKGLGRIVASFRKSGALSDQRRAEIFRKVLAHVEQMEKAVLPLVRELLPTAVREDIGEIAIDFREDYRVNGLATRARKAPNDKLVSTISA
jgi:hypothetical protein